VGKHEIGFARVERDLYPTPRWCIEEALAEHIDLAGLSIWEPACGDGGMVEALKAAGASVYATDIHDYGYALDELDFSTGKRPKRRFDGIITNPPYGDRAKLAERFVEVGLQHIAAGDGFLALLLPVDFDAAKTRRHLFTGCPHFAGKIILTKRIIWFANPHQREAPKENHGWFIWNRSVIRGRQPVTLYAPAFRPDRSTAK
jgi:hypothetical protein